MLNGFFEFIIQFYKTFVPLLIKPGFLTSEYIAGRRIRYIPPYRLFIFLSIFLFALFAFSGRNLNEELFSGNIVAKDSTMVDTLTNRGIIVGQESLNMVKDTVYLQRGKENHAIAYVYSLEKQDKKEQMIKAMEEASDSIIAESWMENKIRGGFINSLKNIEYFWEMLLKRTSQGMFLLLPVFALILKLLYIRSKRYYFHHFIFSNYFHCFIFIILSLIILLSIVLDGRPQKFVNFLYFSIPVYLYIGMKRFYQQSFFKTLGKFLVLSVIYNIILIFFVGGVFVLTLLSM